jgi:O-antigen ligase
MTLSKNSSIYIVIFLFPILVATVQHGGSTLYAFLLLMGCVLGWSAWASLDTWEKRVLVAFFIFFLLIGLSLLNTQDFSYGIKKLGRYISFPLIIPMYLLLKKYQIEAGKSFLLGLVIASVVLMAQANYQSAVLSMYRASGAYSPLIFGDISMLVMVIIVCALITLPQNWHCSALGVGASCMALSAAVMSGAKGAWLLLPVSLIWFLWVKREIIGLKLLLLILIAGVGIVFGSFSLDRVKIGVVNAVNEYQVDLDGVTRISSVGERFELWGNSVIIWRGHPILGTGIGDFESDIQHLFKNGQSRLARSYGHAHSIYFDTLATAGLVGLFAMLIFMQILPFQMFYSFWIKEQDPWLQFYSLAGMTSIIAFAVFGLTEGWLARKPFVHTYIMCILVFMSSIAVRKEKNKDNVVSCKS